MYAVSPPVSQTPRASLRTVDPPPGLTAEDEAVWALMLDLCTTRPRQTAELVGLLRSSHSSGYSRIAAVPGVAVDAGHIRNIGNSHAHQWIALAVPSAKKPSPTPEQPASTPCGAPRRAHRGSARKKTHVARDDYVRSLEQRVGQLLMENERLREH
jgi:hypothetical protein